MIAMVTLVCSQLVAGIDPVETRLIQTAPDNGVLWAKSEGRQRAVILVHGLRPHALHADRVSQALTREWQEPGAELVKAAAMEADVFAFAYGQNVALERIACCRGLRNGVTAVKKLGYVEIVLVGHSAGGLIARHLVEDHPDCGVTKVVQVCSPNTGSSLSNLSFAAPKSHKPFVASLSHEGRETCLSCRKDKKLPADVEFVCVVGRVRGLGGDGVVSLGSQWPDDLQDQGVPMVVVSANHANVVTQADTSRRIAQVIGAEHPRWKPEQVLDTRRRVFSGAAEEPPSPRDR